MAALVVIFAIASAITLFVRQHLAKSPDPVSGDAEPTQLSPRKKSRCDPVPWCAPLVAAAILAFVGAWTHKEWICLDLHGEVFLRLAVAVILVGVSLAAFLHLQRSTVLPKPDWWNLGGTPDTPSWDDVRRMTLGDVDDDPVVYNPKTKYFQRAAKAIGGNIVIGALLIEGLSFLVAGPILPILLSDAQTHNPKFSDPKLGFHTVDLALNANLTAFLALIAAAISIYFTHRQLQAKVKAGSRQAWLDKLRGEISRFIAFADAIHYRPEEAKCDAVHTKLTASRLEMELMLNPSEKDHRLLMFLSIKLSFFEWGDEEFNKIHDVRNLKDAIKRDPNGYKEEDWGKLLGPIPDKLLGAAAHENAYGDLIGYLMRLSHVVLKREWQRVKQTR
ncbi:hypothetical protein [Sphingobium sp. MK2]|uniref:hypothetical protein n=1 Tax=Sphingobium sp. MK2 TaxID=3116540 RepID=UPI0032E35ED4